MGKGKHEDLRADIDDLRRRVAAIEAGAGPLPTPRAHPDLALVQALADQVEAEPTGDGVLVYAAAGRRDERGLTAFQREHDWRSVAAGDAAYVAPVLSALGNRHRIRILQQLVYGDATTQELADAVGEGTTGQLFHHLKELSAVGLVHQPRRGRYSLREMDVVPLLAVLAAGADLAHRDGVEPARGAD